MPRLDRFIEILYQREGDCLGLATEEKIDVTVNGTASSLSRDPLTREQVAALVREIAPAELHPQLANGGGVTFHYSSPSGPVEVRVERGSAGLSASLHPAGGGGGPRPSIGRPPRPPPPRRPIPHIQPRPRRHVISPTPEMSSTDCWRSLSIRAAPISISG